MWAAEDQGFGRTIFDIFDANASNQVFGGPLPVTVGYGLKDTVEKSPAVVQAYVSACYRAQKPARAGSTRT